MGMLRNQVTFSDLSERTQLAIVIVHFFHRFQKDTPQSVWDDFSYAAQEPTESIEDWGDRLEKLVLKLARFGVQVSFDEYLEQWVTGTRDGEFANKLDEAIAADNPNTPPVIYDYPSFQVWYNRYVAKTLAKKKKLQRRSRLLSIHNMRKKVRAPRSKSDKPPHNLNKVDGSRKGPAPAVNKNPHANLFRTRKPPIPLSEKTCFNCGKKGHLAKDCKEPRKPRNMQNQSWRSRFRALADQDDIPDEWEQIVHAFVASVHGALGP